LKIITFLCLENEGGDDNVGLLRSSLINWYLEKIEDQINNESELIEKKSFIEKVLDRLIYNVS
jgi:DNA replication licensing factor MCM6